MENLPLNLVDAFILLVCLVFGIKGLRSGFTRTFLNLLSFLAALLITRFVAPFIATRLSERFELPYLGDALGDRFIHITSWILVFLLFSFLLSSLISPLWKTVRSSSLSALDRTLGLLVGLSKGFFLVILGWALLGSLLFLPQEGEALPSYLKDSRLLPVVDKGRLVVRSFAGKYWKELGLDEKTNFDLGEDPLKAEDLRSPLIAPKTDKKP